jgi:hypothetical protein
MIGVLLMGLVRREKRGIANIGFESFVILVVYAGSVVFMFTAKSLDVLPHWRMCFITNSQPYSYELLRLIRG